MDLNVGILGLQLIGVLFALLMLYTTFLHQKRNELTIRESFFWFAVWSCFLALSAVPTILDFFLVDFLHLNRRIDFFIICGFVFLSGMIFYIYTILRKNQKKMERLVAELALEKRTKN